MNNPANIFTFDWDAEISTETRDRIFDKIVGAADKWRLHMPAVLFFESIGPMSYLGSQAMIHFSPFLAMLFPGGLADVQKCSKLMQDPKNLKMLVDRIVEAEDAARKR
ncbi:hypothetical protein CCAX7_44480 [Capsulimonas corticalis]|uniref:Uncharacterized protein n=1 Tax=Capsulimonas corticalis TaxID=2219043 RepID=A0A402CX66_9BACT|nr:hypothetical protein [Capsulimonas corticalis]BDI32397.1 hypothetical protein CCAX7_44480 [Capsulimonas corticalis]